MAWSTLHIECLKRKLIPELYKYVDMAGNEVQKGWKDDVPHTSGISISLYYFPFPH